MESLKVLLLESPYSYGRDQIVVGKYFPLGIGYLASYLRHNNYPVKIFQPTVDRNFDDELTILLKSYKPDVVGISVMTPTYPKAVALCDMIKKNSDAWTVLGGHHISAVGKDILEQSPNTDFAVIGEGELTLLDLAKELGKNNPDLSVVNGLIWRDANKMIRFNNMRVSINNLDKLPFPAREMVDLSKFRLHSYIDFGKKSATMITSRGCPFKCLFCSSRLTMGSVYRFRSTENVLAEIEEIVYKYNIDHIVFEDDTMTLKRDRIENICEGIMKMKKRLSWYCLSRADTMDKDLAKTMKKAGCKMVAFGIESGSPEVLKKINKRISIDNAIESVRACKEAGMRTQCTFIVGFPYDSMETMEMTLEAAKIINPTIAIFFPLTPYPGTEVYEKFLPTELRPKNVDEWGNFIMTCNKNGISTNTQYSGNELKDIANLWNRRFYYRPKQVYEIARTIKNSSDFANIIRGFLYLFRKTLTNDK